MGKMDIDTIRWTYAVAMAGPGKQLDVEYSTGPMPAWRIREIVGGEFEIRPLRDGTAIAFLRDQDQSQSENPPDDNFHYPGIRGTVLVGKTSGGRFVGALGIA